MTPALTGLRHVAGSEPQAGSKGAQAQVACTLIARRIHRHPPYFHDGSAATLEVAAQTYNVKRSLDLTPEQVADLAAYLKSL